MQCGLSFGIALVDLKLVDPNRPTWRDAQGRLPRGESFTTSRNQATALLDHRWPQLFGTALNLLVNQQALALLCLRQACHCARRDAAAYRSDDVPE
jgi:hypothetical protein